MATDAERLADLITQRTTLLAQIAAAGSTPGQVSIAGSVSYTERSVGELQAALRTVEEEIARIVTPSGMVRTLPRYS